MRATDLLELLLLARRDINLGAILHVRRSNHCANAGSTAGDHSCPSCLFFARVICINSLYAPIFPFTLKRLGIVKSRQTYGSKETESVFEIAARYLT